MEGMNGIDGSRSMFQAGCARVVGYAGRGVWRVQRGVCSASRSQGVVCMRWIQVIFSCYPPSSFVIL